MAIRRNTSEEVRRALERGAEVGPTWVEECVARACNCELRARRKAEGATNQTLAAIVCPQHPRGLRPKNNADQA